MFQATSERTKEGLGGLSGLHSEHATFQTAKEAWFSRQSEHLKFHGRLGQAVAFDGRSERKRSGRGVDGPAATQGMSRAPGPVLCADPQQSTAGEHAVGHEDLATAADDDAARLR
jgi:hypothetical protein